jgi:hypothetical protein
MELGELGAEIGTKIRVERGTRELRVENVRLLALD